MPFMFCQSCGSKMEYTIHKPNFCPSCGTSIAGSTSPPLTKPKENLQPNDEGIKVPNIKKLDVEVIKPEPNTITFGNTIGSGALGSGRRAPYRSQTGDPTKDSLDFCRPSRSKDIDDSGSKKT